MVFVTLLQVSPCAFIQSDVCHHYWESMDVRDLCKLEARVHCKTLSGSALHLLLHAAFAEEHLHGGACVSCVLILNTLVGRFQR